MMIEIESKVISMEFKSFNSSQQKGILIQVVFKNTF